MENWEGLPLSGQRTKRKSKLAQLLAFDEQFLQENNQQGQFFLKGILGVDEVGRGSIIGPVVAAAFAFPHDLIVNTSLYEQLIDLDDSKAPHFTHDKRGALSEHLKSLGYWGIGEASQQEVETLNVAKASLLASYRALQHVIQQFSEESFTNHLVIIDGKLKIPNLSLHQRAYVKADQHSAAVAAASIIAKAYRDTMIIELSQKYPGYGWETNAGYPTPPHKQALATLGATPLHRKTYKAVQEVLDK